MSTSYEQDVDPAELLARRLRCHLCRRSIAPVEAVGPDADGNRYCADFTACNKRAKRRLWHVGRTA